MTATNLALQSGTKPRTSGNPALFWGALIVGLLSMEIGLCAWGIYCATSGSQVVVEADYYNKALHWDDHLALMQASKELGWSTSLQIPDVGGARGVVPVSFQIHDSGGEAIENAVVSIGYFHHAHPLDLRSATLKETGPGEYAADMSLNKRGIWEFRISATRGADHFVQIVQRDIEQ
ncbi:MAG TPA: FixH family protein [Phycisphaerae bacterium]|nr:FixH family protein [Phycisphaerae bacterium]